MASLTRFRTLPLSGESIRHLAGAGLRHSLAGSPLHQAETRLLSYGPESHLQCSGPRLTATPFFWLQAGERMPEEDSHLSDHVRLQAHERGRPVRRLEFGPLAQF